MVPLTFGFTSDDPLITLRYAANVVHGYGPVFNPGQRVEGFTSPLHLVVSIVVFLIPGGHALLKAKLASLLFGVLTVRQAGRLIDVLPLPRWLAGLAYVMAGGSWILGVAAGNALETSLAAWLTTLLITRLVARGPNDGWLVTGMVGAFCVLARAEAVALVVTLGLTSMAVAGEVARPQRVRWVAPPLFIWSAAEALRLAYYRQLLPNTYYAKAGSPGRALRRGVPYLAHSLVPGSGATASAHGVAADALLLVIVALLAVGAFTVVTTLPRLTYAVVVVAVQVLFVVGTGGDWMIGGRFVAPVAVAVIAVEAVGLDAVGHHLRNRHLDAQTFARFSVAIMAAITIIPVVDAHHPVWALPRHAGDAIWSAPAAIPGHLPGRSGCRCSRARHPGA